jgi:hypothetical protein
LNRLKKMYNSSDDGKRLPRKLRDKFVQVGVCCARSSVKAM